MLFRILFMRDSERNGQHKVAVAADEASHQEYDNKGLKTSLWMDDLLSVNPLI